MPTEAPPTPLQGLNPPVPSTPSLVAGLLAAYLEIPQPRVVVYNQRFNVPPDNALRIAVGVIGERVFGSSARQYSGAVGDRPALLEEIVTPASELIDVNLYSFTEEALDRKHEVVAAFNSSLAQALSERWALKFPNVPVVFVDTSGVEGGGPIFRFTANFAVLRARTRIRAIEYFDNFPAPALILNP